MTAAALVGEASDERTHFVEREAMREDRRTVIIVQNGAGVQLGDKALVLEELLAARISSEGFAVISRDVASRSLQEHGIGSSGTLTAMDIEFERSISPLRLAQVFGAEIVLFTTITGYSTDQRRFQGSGVSTVNTVHTLRVTCRLIEAERGGSLRGANATATRTIRSSPGLHIEKSDVIDELFEDAAAQLSARLVEMMNSSHDVFPDGSTSPPLAAFSVVCILADRDNQPVTVPNLRIEQDNQVLRGVTELEVHALHVTVELDGLTIGTAPGTFQVSPGLHRLRLSRSGFEPWERTINVVEGQSLTIPLRMSDESYERWRNQIRTIEGLRNGDRLTAAQAKLLEGMGTFWSESHYRVDTQEGSRIYPSRR